jgi:hypothetical protein
VFDYTGVIMTSRLIHTGWRNFFRLLPSIVEHLNAEVVLLTVSDVGLAIDWLKCSFLYVRIKKVTFITCCTESSSIASLHGTVITV